MNNFQKQHWHNNQQNNQNQEQSNFSTQNQQQPNHQTNQQPSILTQIAGACLPILMNQFTGQNNMPSPLGGNNMEMTLVLSQVLTLQQQILTIQQSLSERISSLESNLVSLGDSASNQFTNLVQEVKGIKSIRLTHERKQIELNGNNFNQSQQHQET